MKVELKEAFSKIKALIQKFEDSNKPEVKFVEAELKDGTKVKIEPALAKDAKVIMVDAEGKEAPAPDGDYAVKAADGIMLVKVVGGVITEEPKKEENRDREE